MADADEVTDMKLEGAPENGGDSPKAGQKKRSTEPERDLNRKRSPETDRIDELKKDPRPSKPTHHKRKHPQEREHRSRGSDREEKRNKRYRSPSSSPARKRTHYGRDSSDSDRHERRERRNKRFSRDKSDKKRRYSRSRSRDYERYERREHVTTYKDNIKSRFDQAEETNDPAQIRRQVEFYFSDSNLPTDAHLFDLTGGIDNKPVDLEVITSFKRMQRFKPFTAIVDALKESKTLDLSENHEITRKVPLSDKFTSNPELNGDVVDEITASRSIYAEGFDEESANSQLDLEAFFEPYGPIASVRLRRDGEGVFIKSVYVEFDSEEKQKAFLAADPKPQFNGEALTVQSKKDFLEENPGAKEMDNAKRGSARSFKEHRPEHYKQRHRYERGFNDKGYRERKGADLKEKSWKKMAEEDNKEEEMDMKDDN